MAQTTFGRRNLPKPPKPPRPSNRSVASTSLADDLALGIPGPGCRWLVPALFGLVLPVAALTAALATFGSVPAATEAAISLVAAAGTTKPAGCKVSLGDFEKLGKGLPSQTPTRKWAARVSSSRKRT